LFRCLAEHSGEDRFSQCDPELTDAFVCSLTFYTPKRGDWRTIPDFVEKSITDDYHINPGNAGRYLLAVEEVGPVAVCSLG
jgi:hypothetical protein